MPGRATRGDGAEVEVPQTSSRVERGLTRSFWTVAAGRRLPTELGGRQLLRRLRRFAGLGGRHGRQRWLLDLKTSRSGVYGETALQLAGYRFAEVYVDSGGVEQPMPEVDRCAVVWVRAEIRPGAGRGGAGRVPRFPLRGASGQLDRGSFQRCCRCPTGRARGAGMSGEVELRRDTDNWVEVLPAVGDLATQISGTEFVPVALRGKPAAIAAAILTGREVGIPPMQSLSGIHVVDGWPTLSSELMRQRCSPPGIAFGMSRRPARAVSWRGGVAVRTVPTRPSATPPTTPSGPGWTVGRTGGSTPGKC